MTTKPLLRSLHIGVGNRGVWPLRYATPERGFQPVALCDPHRPALEAARELCRLTDAACFSEVDAALENARADCAIICAPTHLHVPLVKQCVAAGLSVLVEKGMAPSWEDACDLAAWVARQGARVAVAQNYRYQPGERAISHLLRNPESSQAVGRPFLAVYQQLRVRPEPKNLTYPFASIWDMSCHHFDTLLDWFGPIQSATAQAWGAPWSAYAHPNNTSAHLVFGNGVHVHYLHGHDASRSSLRVEIHGEQGAAVWTDDSLSVSRRPPANFGQAPETEVPLRGEAGEIGVLEDFHRYVVEGTEPGISVRHNLEVMALCQMMVLSIQQGQTIHRSDLKDGR